jgi:hypothetical protein
LSHRESAYRNEGGGGNDGDLAHELFLLWMFALHDAGRHARESGAGSLTGD